GVILYELLTDSPPFSRESLRAAGYEEMRRIIREVDPEKPSQRLTTQSAETSTLAGKRDSDLRRVMLKLQSELDWVVMKAIEKDRQRRYDSVDAFADDILCYLSDQPVRACPPSLLYRCTKYYRKNRIGVLATAAVLLCLVAGFTSTAVQWVRAERLAESEAALRKTAESLAETESRARELSDARLYVSQIRRADTEWEAGNYRIAKRTLAETRADHRGWEHQLLRSRFSADSLAVGEGHEGPILSLSFGKAGKQIITGGADGTIRYWDADSLLQTERIEAHSAPVNALVLTPDGKTIVSAGEDQKVKFWDFASGDAQRELDHTSQVNALAISPDGKHIAYGGSDGDIQLWNLTTQELGKRYQPKFGSILTLAFSPDGDHFASGTDRNVLDFWNVDYPLSSLGSAAYALRTALGAPDGLLDRYTGHNMQVTGVQFSPYEFLEEDWGPIALSAGDDGMINGWAYQDGQQFLYYSGHTKPIRDLQISPDEISFASAGADGTVRLWRYDEGVEAAQFRGHLSEVNCVGFSPDGKRLASGGEDGRLILWGTNHKSIRSGWYFDEPDQFFDFEDLGDYPLLSVTSPDGKQILNVGFGSLAVLEIAIQQDNKVDLRSNDFAHATWRPDGEQIVVSFRDGSVDYIDASSLDVVKSDDTGMSLDTHFQDKQGNIFLVSGQMVALWDADTQTTIRKWTAGAPISNVWSNGESLAYVTDSGEIEIFDFSSDTRLASFRTDSSPQNWISISEDSKKVAVVNQQGRLKIWDITSGELKQDLDLSEPVLSSASIDLDANRLLTGNENGFVRLWDLYTGEYLLALPAWENIGARVYAVDVSEDQTKIVCVSESTEVYIWDLSADTPTERSSTTR
ncbi:MAG TPA: hypothetical protein DDW52_22595, partial [Planctomycetaceae bacterium]|nr:hypothetical protein [Planctomycetaceae bacterium]